MQSKGYNRDRFLLGRNIMVDLVPEVQIHLIDLAWKIVETTTRESAGTRDNVVKERLERFDQAYKAVVKTITAS
jgi:hypothetical protein